MERFGATWCLSPEQSLLYLAGNRTVPRQLMVRSPRARNRITALPHNTSLFDVRAALPKADDMEVRDDLRLFSPEAALIACSSRIFSSKPTDMRAVLLTLRDASRASFADCWRAGIRPLPEDSRGASATAAGSASLTTLQKQPSQPGTRFVKAIRSPIGPGFAFQRGKLLPMSTAFN